MKAGGFAAARMIIFIQTAGIDKGGSRPFFDVVRDRGRGRYSAPGAIHADLAGGRPPGLPVWYRIVCFLSRVHPRYLFRTNEPRLRQIGRPAAHGVYVYSTGGGVPTPATVFACGRLADRAIPHSLG